jgi:prepilin-type N-terminal cleavage/methylation domain-containing protein
MNSRRHINDQFGFSLVELMVALAIGFVVILGVSGIFVGSRQNYAAQDESSKFQENIRLASELISRTLKHAGHRAPSLSHFASGSAGAPLTKESDTVFGVEGVEGTGVAVGAQDSVTVRYQGNGLVSQNGAAGGMITDCLGSSIGTVPAPGEIESPIVFNTFAVQQINGRPWLVCSTGVRSGTAANDPVVPPVGLIPDVEGIEVMYGIHEDADLGQPSNAGTTARYIRQSDGLPALRARISAIRVFLLIRTEADVSPIVDNQTYTLAERTYGPFNDKRMRRVVEISAALRNWNP